MVHRAGSKMYMENHLIRSRRGSFAQRCFLLHQGTVIATGKPISSVWEEGRVHIWLLTGHWRRLSSHDYQFERNLIRLCFASGKFGAELLIIGYPASHFSKAPYLNFQYYLFLWKSWCTCCGVWYLFPCSVVLCVLVWFAMKANVFWVCIILWPPPFLWLLWAPNVVWASTVAWDTC